jgi:hypothetical protein
LESFYCKFTFRFSIICKHHDTHISSKLYTLRTQIRCQNTEEERKKKKKKRGGGGGEEEEEKRKVVNNGWVGDEGGREQKQEEKLTRHRSWKPYGIGTQLCPQHK